MSGILIVSNRLPVRVRTEGGGFELEPSVGGLATGLRPFHRRSGSMWVGWPGIPSEEASGLEGLGARLEVEGCVPVDLPRELVDGYYYGFANRTVWPLFHYFQQYTEFDESQWDSYVEANERFADRIAGLASPGQRVWIHDYHLMLLPGMLKARIPDSTIGFFLHIPFPSFELFRLLPWREELVDGLLGADLIGFHSYDYARHFFSTVLRLSGYERTLDTIEVSGRKVSVDVFPIAIDYERFAGSRTNPEVVRSRRRFETGLEGRRMVLSVDRLDYTKGILQRLEAFERFLEENPRYRSEVCLVLLVVPSRTSVPRYAELKLELDRRVGEINSRFGGVAGGPVSYMYRSLPFEELAALYGAAEVGLVTPVRDGMNLVAKEYVACQGEESGVLVLSEMAGAVMELSEALVVNPNDTGRVSRAILEALEMEPAERRRRMELMQRRLRRYDIRRWAGDFMEELERVRRLQSEETVRTLGPDDREELVRSFEGEGRRLVLLDMDGVLVEGRSRRGELELDRELVELVRALRRRRETYPVLLTARDMDEVDEILGELDADVAAEDGAWIHERGGRWRMLAPVQSDWKESIRPLLEFYEDRTPGAHLEERDFSLTWDFSRVEPVLADVRSRKLLQELYDITAAMDLEVVEAAKALVVRNAGLNKGRAALHWLEKTWWDVVVAIAGASTGEDLLARMPERAFTLRVGAGHTAAAKRIASMPEVRELLRELAGGGEG